MSEVFIECWQCHTQVTLSERSEEDGFCPHCVCELDLEDYLEQSVAAIDTLRTANQRLEGEVRDLTERRNDIARKLIGKNQEWKALIALLQKIYQTPLDRFYRDGLNVKINAELVRAAALSTANGEVAE